MRNQKIIQVFSFLSFFSFLIFFVFSLSFLIISSVVKASVGSIQKGGGSNYFIYDYGNATSKGNSWNETIRPVIGTFHLNPLAVETQLRQIYTSGQTRISLVLWHMPFTTEIAQQVICSDGQGNPKLGCRVVEDMWVHVVNSRGGTLSAQHKKNLRAVLQLIRNIGFKELIFRFAPQGDAFPGKNGCWWDAVNHPDRSKEDGFQWCESQYLENLDFIINTRNLIENELSSTSVSRIYDLGVELGGLGLSGYNEAPELIPSYVRRLWSDYTNRFGARDSYGFSVIYAHYIKELLPDGVSRGRGRLEKMIQDFKQVGVLPPYYAVDIYGEEDRSFLEAYNELKKEGEQNKPLILQEVYQNKPQVMNRLLDVLKKVPLLIYSIFQWPDCSNDLLQGIACPSIVPTEYGVYGGSTQVSGTLMALPCNLEPGQTECRTQLSWSTSNGVDIALYRGNTLLSSKITGNMVIDHIKMNEVSQFSLRSGQNILGTVSLTAKASGTPRLFTSSRANPNLVSTSDSLQSIYVRGSNISSSCSVSIFAPDWTSRLALLPANCSPDLVSFKVPDDIQNGYSQVHINVNNSNGTWSDPILINIQSPVPVLYKAGLGCSANQCIWANGSNISRNCSVQIFDSLGKSLLGTVTSVRCELNSISFEIPSNIRQGNTNIQIKVKNISGVVSSALLVKIK